MVIVFINLNTDKLCITFLLCFIETIIRYLFLVIFLTTFQCDRYNFPDFITQILNFLEFHLYSLNLVPPPPVHCKIEDSLKLANICILSYSLRVSVYILIQQDVLSSRNFKFKIDWWIICVSCPFIWFNIHTIFIHFYTFLNIPNNNM